jgi:hypothetical protein
MNICCVNSDDFYRTGRMCHSGFRTDAFVRARGEEKHVAIPSAPDRSLQSMVTVLFPTQTHADDIDLLFVDRIGHRGQLSGTKITLALPQHTTIKNDMLPILEFFNRGPHLTCEIFAHGVRASVPRNAPGPGMAGPTIPFLWERDSIRDFFFAPIHSLRAYIATSPVPPLVKPRIIRVMLGTSGIYRRHISMTNVTSERTFGAALHTVFDRRDEQEWMDGKKVHCQRPHASPTRQATLRSTKVRRKRDGILQFLCDAVLDHHDIKYHLDLTFSVQ